VTSSSGDKIGQNYLYDFHHSSVYSEKPNLEVVDGTLFSCDFSICSWRRRRKRK
jgi:hypothetical protein